MTGHSPQGGQQDRQHERPTEVRVLRVIDGDTVEVQQRGTIWHSYPKERIRLWGIDAPETSQRGGRESTRYLQRMIGRRRDIWLDRVDTDQYGRTVGIIYPRARSSEDAYNYEMVRGGHAHCYMLSGGSKPGTGPRNTWHRKPSRDSGNGETPSRPGTTGPGRTGARDTLSG